VRPQVVRKDKGHPPALPGAGQGRTELVAEQRGGALRANAPVEPAVAPSDQAEAVHLAVVTRRLDQALAAPPFAAPDPGKGGMEGNLHLILEVQIRVGKEGQQLRYIGGELIPQVRLHEVGQG
jgi:hypothetical protein